MLGEWEGNIYLVAIPSTKAMTLVSDPFKQMTELTTPVGDSFIFSTFAFSVNKFRSNPNVAFNFEWQQFQESVDLMANKDKTNWDNQVKSKERVANHGEVFTSEREVNAMLDLVKQETERIESRFLEPACGDGNFLAEILRRKLDVVEARYKKSQLEFERYAVLAVSSIYGVDILQDNVEDCRVRLYNIFNERYTSIYRSNCKEDCKRSVNFILDKNILWGDALSLRTPDEKSEPIVFTEWEAVNGSMMKRREYTLEKLLLPRHSASSNDLFSDLGEQAFLPNPVKTHPPIHFMKLGVDDTDELQP